MRRWVIIRGPEFRLDEGIYMKSLLLALLITLGFISSVSAQEHSSRPPKVPPTTSTPVPSMPPVTSNSSVWTKFTSDEGHFSVLMPGTPENKVETRPATPGPYTTHLFILRQEQNVFLIGWVDYDPNFKFDIHAELEMNRDNFVKGLQATLLTTQTRTINGFLVIEFTAETAEKIFSSRVYMVGRRPYQIVIGSPKGVDDTININRFFNSFKINPN
jgi:hypothetical protein